MTRRRPGRPHKAARPAAAVPPERAARGAQGEALAAEFLRRAGYSIEAQNLRTKDAEIDLLARRRRLWIAVEVKTRREHPAPERCLEPAQRARLVRALSALAPVLRPSPSGLRVDVIAVRLPDGAAPELLHFAGHEFDPPSR